MTTVGPLQHEAQRSDPHVSVLKSVDYDRHRAATGVLPYRIDHLANHGYRPTWSDAPLPPRLRGPVARLERATVPVVQAWRQRRERRDAVATIAMFESEGHGLALARRLTGRRRPPLVVVACWLADLVVRSPRRARLYRFLYRAVDDVVVFSSNQVPVLVDRVGLAPERVHVVRFGIDLDEVTATEVSETGTVVAVGRDLGRDWSTLTAAARGTGWTVELVTRARQVAGADLPAEVRRHDPLPRAEYLELLAAASVVVVPTDVREYPTGQTVLLEALALGKACVVTDTPAMSGYVDHERTALVVAPHDPEALRAAIDRLLGDDALRTRLGTAARTAEAEHGGAAAMWAEVAGVIDHRRGIDR